MNTLTMEGEPKTIKLGNGNMAHICTYKIIKGQRAGQDCGIIIRSSDHIYCCQHRRTYDNRRKRIAKINEMGIGGQ